METRDVQTRASAAAHGTGSCAVLVADAGRDVGFRRGYLGWKKKK